MRRVKEFTGLNSEGTLHAVANSFPGMVRITGLDWGCTFFNRHWLEFTGRQIEDECGEGWLAGVHPDDRPSCLTRYRAAFDARERCQIEYRLLRYDGEYRQVLDRGSCHYDARGRFAGYISNAVDLTDTVRVFRDSEILLTRVFASLVGHVALIDRTGMIFKVNEAWNRFGRENGASHKSMGIGANYLHPCRSAFNAGDRLAGEALDGIEAVLKGVLPRYAMEYQCATLWFQMIVSPLQRPEGGAIITHLDISELRRAQVQAQKAVHDLYHVSRVATAGQLMASLAHEISQPLGAIHSNSECARELLRVEKPDVAQLREIMADIESSGERVLNIITRLRSLMQKGKSELKAVKLNDLVRDVLALLAKSSMLNDVDVALRLSREDPIVHGDQIQLQQVVLNLVMNACQAMAASPSARHTLTVSTRVESDFGVVSIRDTGPGIPPDQLSRVFEPFFTTKTEGIGMGLAICSSIVDAHRGRIWVENNRTTGTTFNVMLPVTNSCEDCKRRSVRTEVRRNVGPGDGKKRH